MRNSGWLCTVYGTISFDKAMFELQFGWNISHVLIVFPLLLVPIQDTPKTTFRSCTDDNVPSCVIDKPLSTDSTLDSTSTSRSGKSVYILMPSLQMTRNTSSPTTNLYITGLHASSTFELREVSLKGWRQH